MQKKIVITGGPGTGKSTVIASLADLNYECMFEVSREVTLNARKNGTEQLFQTNPLLFSELLLEGRVNQYIEAETKNSDLVFFDRGIPDVHAYMNYFNIEYPNKYHNSSKLYKYDLIFVMPPWEDIYTSDSVRYENFEQALAIHGHIKSVYNELNYSIIEVPTGSVSERTEYILSRIR